MKGLLAIGFEFVRLVAAVDDEVFELFPVYDPSQSVLLDFRPIFTF